jgi:hypothetical protein
LGGNNMEREEIDDLEEKNIYFKKEYALDGLG